MTNGTWDDEIAIGQSLHEGARAQPVRAVVGEIRFSGDVQAFDIAHQIVVHPEPAHRVVHGRVDSHRHLVRILVRDALVHLEQIAVAFFYHVSAEPLDCIGKVEIDAKAGFTHSPALVADLLCGARGDVTRSEIPERRILPLQEVIAFGFRDLPRVALIARLLRNPHASVVSQRLAHQRELRLMLAAHRNARWVNLRKARIRKGGTALVSAPDRGGVRSLGVGREVENVAVAAGREHNGIGGV